MKRMYLLITLLLCMLVNSVGMGAETLVAVKDESKGLWGYKAETGGEWVVKPKYETAYPFFMKKVKGVEMPMAFVKEKGKWALINEKGKPAQKIEYDNVKEYKGGDRYIIASQGGKYGYFGTGGYGEIECVFDDAPEPKTQYIFPKINGDEVVVDLKSKAILGKLGPNSKIAGFEFQCVSRNDTIYLFNADKEFMLAIPSTWEIMPYGETLLTFRNVNKDGMGRELENGFIVDNVNNISVPYSSVGYIKKEDKKTGKTDYRYFKIFYTGDVYLIYRVSDGKLYGLAPYDSRYSYDASTYPITQLKPTRSSSISTISRADKGWRILHGQDWFVYNDDGPIIGSPVREEPKLYSKDIAKIGDYLYDKNWNAISDDNIGEIIPATDEFIIVKDAKTKLYGVMDNKAEWKYDPKYKEIKPIYNWTSSFGQDYPIGYEFTDANGNKKKMSATMLEELDILDVKVDNKKWAFVDNKGNVVSDWYDDGWDRILNSGIAAAGGYNMSPTHTDRIIMVSKNGKYGLYDKTTRKEITPCIYDEIGVPSYGMTRVKKGNLCGYINKAGKLVIPCKYLSVGRFREVFTISNEPVAEVIVSKNGSFYEMAIINKEGRVLKKFSKLQKYVNVW